MSAEHKPQSRPRVAIVREALTEPSAIEAFESVWAELGDNQRARFALFRQNEQLLKQAEDFESERAAMHAEVARLVEQLETLRLERDTAWEHQTRLIVERDGALEQLEAERAENARLMSQNRNFKATVDALSEAVAVRDEALKDRRDAAGDAGRDSARSGPTEPSAGPAPSDPYPASVRDEEKPAQDPEQKKVRYEGPDRYCPTCGTAVGFSHVSGADCSPASEPGDA